MALQKEYGAGPPTRKKKATPQKADLAPSPEPGRISNKALAVEPEGKKPSEKAKERVEARRKGKPMSEGLTEAAAVFPREGPVGSIIGGALSGAAAGATLGETIAQLQQEKAQRGNPVEPKALSEKVMAGVSPTVGGSGPSEQEKARKRRGNVYGS